MMAMLRPSSQATASSTVALARLIEKAAPLLACTRLGLPQSVSAGAAITSSTPAASAVLRIAPRLPGFSSPLQTRTSGLAETSVSGSRLDQDGKTASHPSAHL